MALVKCPHCQHTVSDVASVCPGCRANLASARVGQPRTSGQTMLCSRCSARLPKNAPVCCNCGTLEPKPKRSVFRPVMIGLAASLAVLIVAAGARYNRSTTPVVAMTSAPAVDEPAGTGVEAEAAPDVTPVRPIVPPPPERLDPPPNTVRRWTSTWVNVREGRGTDNAVVATLDPGVPVEVYDRRQSWWAVMESGRHLGYVANSVLLQEPPPGVAPGIEPPLVSQRAGR